MTELLTGVEAPSDAELISSVRGGDLSAYGELFARHVDAARRLGRQLVRGPDVDDLVSDAFAKTLNVLQNGGGPDVAFRAYLLTSLRRLHVDKIRAAKKVQPEEDMTVFDDGVPFQDPAIASFDNGAAAKAFASLPERWQLVLWHLEVEGQKPADIAPLLGMTPNSVSALAYRAREGLRQAFLTMHLANTPTEQCRWVNEHLGAYVRKGLSKRDTTKVEDHLEDCRRCTAMYLELNEVNSNLAGIIAPLLLGAAAAGYISSAGGAGVTGVSALFGRFRDAVSGNGATGGAGAGGSTTAAGGGAAVTTGGLITAGGVVAASVAAITAAAFIFGGGAEKEVITEADQPIGIVQTPAPGAGEDREPREKSAAEDSESVEVTEADEPTAEDVPFAAATEGGGFDLDGTADSPDDFPAAPAGDFDVVAPPVVAPADPAPADDNPAAPQDNTPPPSGDDPVAEDPGTDPGADPGAEEPGTDRPGTDPDTGTPPGSAPPSSEQPSAPTPTEPADDPQDPAPGDNTGDTPGDGDQTQDPAPLPVRTALSVSALDVVDGTISLSFDGAELDSSVRLAVSSEPAGINIAEGGDCSLDTSTGTWLCSPNGAAASSLARVLATAVALQTTSGYTVDVPLSIPPDQADNTEVTFEYLLDGEEAEPGTETVNLRIANVALSAVADPVSATETDGQFSVRAGLSGVAQETTTVDYSITTPGAKFVASDFCRPTEDGLSTTCDVPANGVQEFLLGADDTSVDTPVTIVAAPVPGFIDTHLDNNDVQFLLPRATAMDPRFEMDESALVIAEIPGNGDASFKRITVQFNGVEDGDRIDLLLTNSQTFFCSDATCTDDAGSGNAERERSVTVEGATEGRFTYTFGMKLPGDSPATLQAVLNQDSADEEEDALQLKR